MSEYSAYSKDPTARFNEAVNRELVAGSKIESQHDWTVVFLHGKPVKHVMHLIITLVTCGIWAWGWAIVSLNGGVRRVRVYVDNTGQVRREEEPLPPWYKRGGGIALICLVVLAVIAGIAGAAGDKSADPVAFTSTPTETTTTSGAAKAANPPATKDKPKKVVPPKLSQEEQFVAVIEKARNSADDADNQFRRRLALTKRNDSICKLLKTKTIKNWTGEVKTLDTNGDGLGVLTIQVGDNIKVGTWNNALSDFEDNTLIKKNSPVFDAMADLNEGDTVTFSGTFIHDTEDCIGEQSITDNGSTQSPSFTFRFSKLAVK